jgi:hypothetical protein
VAPSGLSIPALAIPSDPSVGKGGQELNHCMDFVTPKKSLIVALIEFQRHVAPRQHALTIGRKRGCNDDRRGRSAIKKAEESRLVIFRHYGRDFSPLGSAELDAELFEIRLSQNGETLARCTNLPIAQAAYRAAAKMYPDELIELRHGARVIERNR